MFELKHLRSLLALKSQGSLAAAADVLHISQSALSHQLTELEQRLARPLFLRKSRPLRFTADGMKLVALAESVLPQIDELTCQLRGEQPPAQLCLAVECHSCIRWLTPALQQIQRLYPALELTFANQQGFEPQQALLAGEVDVVLTADLLPSEGIFYAPLFEFEMRLVLPTTHRLMLEAMITPAHLSDEILLSYPVELQRLDVMRHFMQPVGLKPKQIKMVDNTLMLTQMVAAGWGITVLPDWVCQEFEPQQLMVSKPLGKGLWRRLHAAIRVQDRQRPEIQVLLKALQPHPAA